LEKAHCLFSLDELMNGGLTLVAYGFLGSLYIPVLESWGNRFF